MYLRTYSNSPSLNGRRAMQWFRGPTGRYLYSSIGECVLTVNAGKEARNPEREKKRRGKM